MPNYRTSALVAALNRPGEAESIATDYDSLRLLVETLRERLGRLQFISFGVTVGVAIGCMLWAINDGVSLGLALMAAYCVIISGIVLCVAQLVLAHVHASRAPAPGSRKPNYAAWKVVEKFNVSNASRLWCDIEPGHPYSQESSAWAAAMLDAIKSGALPVSPKPYATAEMVAREQANPGWNTEVSREALRTWAMAHGHCPTFLRQ